MTMPVFEASSSDSLPEVAERLLTDNDIHIGIVRDLVPEEFHDAMFGLKTDEEVNEVMQTMIPKFDVFQALVKAWWQTNGYHGHEIEDPINFRNVTAGNDSTSHVDDRELFDPNKGLQLVGGLTLSIAAGLQPDAYADYAAKKPARLLDNPSSRQFSRRDFSKHMSWGRRTKRYPAEVRQYSRDGVLITQYPIASAHRIKSHNQRQARLIDFPIDSSLPVL
jgi:hypothetical protein